MSKIVTGNSEMSAAIFSGGWDYSIQLWTSMVSKDTSHLVKSVDVVVNILLLK